MTRTKQNQLFGRRLARHKFALCRFALCISGVLIAALCLSGCAGKATPAQTGKAFVEKVLTIPDQGLAGLADPQEIPLQTPGPGDENDAQLLVPTEEYNEKLRTAIEKLCGDVIEKDEMTDPESRFFQSVILLHLKAAEGGFTTTVKSVTVSGTDGAKFSYEAVLDASYTEEPVTVLGSVYFNEDGRIYYMNVDSMSEYPPSFQ